MDQKSWKIQKVGKTTVSVELSTSLARFYGKRTLLVDLDPPNGHIEQPVSKQLSRPRSIFTREELSEKHLPELKSLAKELNVLVRAPIRKDDLIQKILAKSADGRSEQRTIQDL